MIIDTEKWCCKNCKHRPMIYPSGDVYGPPKIINPGTVYAYQWYDETCPYLCDDSFYNRMPLDKDFCSSFKPLED